VLALLVCEAQNDELIQAAFRMIETDGEHERSEREPRVSRP
jgi:hypothetical protein